MTTLTLALLLLMAAVPGASGLVSVGSRRPTPCTRGRCRMLAGEALEPSDVLVMVNGVPGPMAVEVASACLRRGMILAPCALTGRSRAGQTLDVAPDPGLPTVSVTLFDGTDQEQRTRAAEALAAAKAKSKCRHVVCVDYTHPSATNSNAAWYAENGLNFVMGTTGGDRIALAETVTSSDLYAVIAPNMAKQIVAVQAALEDVASKFPGAFQGYKLKVTESHQATKADTSGTAKAMVRALNTLNQEFEYRAEDEATGAKLEQNIVRLREREQQLDFGVPETALQGHAFHTYSLVSPDGTVEFALQHNVVGRRVYAEGTADAVSFLAAQAVTSGEKRLFTMIDVLQAGAMG